MDSYNKIEIDAPKALEFILSQIYFKEFEIIDRLNQHPAGLNFNEWLLQKGIARSVDHPIKKE